MKPDDIDLKILDLLQENGRITNVDLSARIGLSPAPTLERVKKLENAGYIESYHAIVNAQKLGLNVLVFIEISLHLHKDAGINDFIAYVNSLPEVKECYHITGGADFLLKVYAPDLASYQRLIVDKLAKAKEIGQIQSKVVLATTKRDLSVPIDHLEKTEA